MLVFRLFIIFGFAIIMTSLMLSMVSFAISLFTGKDEDEDEEVVEEEKE